MGSYEMVYLLLQCDKNDQITLDIGSGNGHFYYILVIEFTIS